VVNKDQEDIDRVDDRLLQRIRDECQHLLILIQQQHRPQVSKSFIGKPRRSKELEAFYLPEVSPFS
jgi:hypothetical protein